MTYEWALFSSQKAHSPVFKWALYVRKIFSRKYCYTGGAKGPLSRREVVTKSYNFTYIILSITVAGSKPKTVLILSDISVLVTP